MQIEGKSQLEMEKIVAQQSESMEVTHFQFELRFDNLDCMPLTLLLFVTVGV
jgi:hypothetical protein